MQEITTPKHDAEHIVLTASGMLSSLILLLTSSEGDCVSRRVLIQALEGVNLLLNEAAPKD
jgi:hypothetical protein